MNSHTAWQDAVVEDYGVAPDAKWTLLVSELPDAKSLSCSAKPSCTSVCK